MKRVVLDVVLGVLFLALVLGSALRPSSVTAGPAADQIALLEARDDVQDARIDALESAVAELQGGQPSPSSSSSPSASPTPSPAPTPGPTASPTPTPPATPSPSPSPSPTPSPTPPATAHPFSASILLVQGETGAGYRRVADGAGAIYAGQHYSAFGPDCKEPTGASSRFKQVTGVPKMLFAAIAPADLDVNGVGCAGSNSRLKDTAQVQTFAQRIITVLNADRDIVAVNFWNELKGYWSSSLNDWDVDRFTRDYITFATAIRAARPDVKIGGPYSTGGSSTAQLTRIHQAFIDKVVRPHPELVDFIAWDDGDGSRHAWYTGFYASRGVALPHWDVEFYPGGCCGGADPGVAVVVRNVMGMAIDPLMAGAFVWGSGTDSAMKARMWSGTNATPTANWIAYVTTAKFTAGCPCSKAGTDTWTNAAGQTLRLSGSTVSVTP